MTESTDQPSDSPAGREVVARADHDGIAVRKVATMHGSEAVAVYFSIRSIRDDQCTVRIADALPEPLRDHEVEFHPKYDPANWSRSDGTVVYSATVPPDANRTTVYGVVVDSPDHLALFTAEPAVEVNPNDPPGSSSPSGSDDGSFTFGPTEDAAESTAEESAVTGSGRGSSGTDAAGRATQPAAEPGVVEALVSEVRRRDLTDPERRALRGALALDSDEAAEPRLDALRQEVEALRDEVASADREATDVDRIESRVEALSESIDRRYASLTDEIEALAAALDREVQWRSRLRDSLEFDPEAE